MEEVRDARRVQARVLLDLIAEARSLHALFEQRPPVRMERLIDPLLEIPRPDLDLAEQRAHPLDRPLRPLPFGLQIAERLRGVTVRPVPMRQRDPHVTRRRRAVAVRALVLSLR